MTADALRAAPTLREALQELYDAVQNTSIGGSTSAAEAALMRAEEKAEAALAHPPEGAQTDPTSTCPMCSKSLPKCDETACYRKIERLGDEYKKAVAAEGAQTEPDTALIRGALNAVVGAPGEAWLIEHIGSEGPPRWWRGVPQGQGQIFTTDPNHAVRFCRREDAEAVARHMILVKVTSHGWFAEGALHAPSASSRSSSVDLTAASMTVPQAPLQSPSVERRNALGDIERPDLDRFAYEHHWQRPDGTIYKVDSSD